MNEELYVPYGSAAEGPFSVSVLPGRPGWGWAGLRVLGLGAGESAAFGTGDHEVNVLPLAGSAVVDAAGERFELQGWRSVFSRVSDFAYFPPGSDLAVSCTGGGRFALPSAPASRRLTARYVPAGKVPVELRGAGQCSRQVSNFATPEAFEAGALIACEVLTPAANWSSYPPHKHDGYREGAETELEEVYYLEVAGAGGMAYQRVYGTSERPVDLLAEVRTGDVVLIPHGWHGPSMAVPGCDLYYLNVMAGPSPERAWRICDDPAHAWIRDTWPGQSPDPRLPLATAAGAPGAGEGSGR